MRRETTWTQTMLEGLGTPEATLKLSVHLDGPAGLVQVGWTVIDTRTGAWLASEVQPAMPDSVSDDVAAAELARAMGVLREFLTPF